MKRVLQRIKSWILQIGIPNAILILFIFISVCVTALYQTFSLYTASEGLSIVDNIKTYQFILSASNQENSVTIAAHSMKKFTLTISNSDDVQLIYGVYYSSSDNLDDVDVGYTSVSEYQGSGTIPANQNYVADCQVYNGSTNDVTISFGIKYGFENGGSLILDTGEIWLEKSRIVVESETNDEKTYYTNLTDAIADASTTSTTMITLLDNIKEDVTNTDVALYDTVINLNQRTLDGFFYNSNANSNVTLKNGTIENNTPSTIAIKNVGTMTILSGNYINNQDGHCIVNLGTMTIEDGSFQIAYAGSTGTTIYNESSSTLTVNGGTLETTSWGIVNHGATVNINSMRIHSSSRYDLLNRAGGTTTLKNSVLNGSSVILNEEGTVVALVTQLNGSISGVVYGFGWNSDGSAEWQVYGKSDGACATWTSNNGQDDLKWVTMSSFTGTYNTYLYCRVYKSDHNNESGTYITHIYNAAKTTFYYGCDWTM